VNSDWLAQLAPDHPPPSAGWWPPAPGWWAVLALSLLLLACVVLWWRRRDPFLGCRLAALREIRNIEEEAFVDEGATARAIQSVIRRYAIAVFGRERVARLTGESWLRFIGDQGGSVLAGTAGRSLIAAAFANQHSGQRDDWLIGAREFVQRVARGNRTGR
jgi:Domain of unknown function (DUF4381)